MNLSKCLSPPRAGSHVLMLSNLHGVIEMFHPCVYGEVNRSFTLSGKRVCSVYIIALQCSPAVELQSEFFIREILLHEKPFAS